MATFTPSTYDVANLPESDHKRHSLWRHFGNMYNVGYHVLITSGTATASPGRTSPDTDDIAGADAGSGEGGKAWFRGGITYTVTSAEETALLAAGYTMD